MFDIGFAELSLIFVLGLLVLGPERLPKVARTLGYWFGRARSTFNHLRNELEREAVSQDMQGRMEKQMRQMGLDEESIREAKESLLSPDDVARARAPRDTAADSRQTRDIDHQDSAPDQQQQDSPRDD